MAEEKPVDYTLANPDTLTKYKQAGQISQKILATVAGWCVEDANIVELCEKGDKLIEDEVSKVYKGKKIPKGQSHPTTISPNAYITPYTPLKSDAEEAGTTLKKGEVVKIQLGAQIDGLGTIVCDSVIVPAKGGKPEITERDADLMLATYYSNELMLRMMMPPGLLASNEEDKKAAAGKKPYSQSQMNTMLDKVVKSFKCSIVESTTTWLFEHNEIEGNKKIIMSPGDNLKGEGLPNVGEVWGVEVGVSLGSGKTKTLNNRTTLHRRTNINYSLKRPSSRQTLSEVVKKFGTFPFSMRQLDDERGAKVGIVESVRANVLRQYEVVADKDSEAVARLWTTVAITKNGIQRLAAPPTWDLDQYKSKTKNRIEDEEILKLLELPTSKALSTKPKSKKKKKKPAAKKAESSSEEDSDDSD